MLNKKTMIEKLGKEYKPMFDKINIADFTKCIAQYSGRDMQNLKDEVIEEYLTLWAKNKKHFFDLFGDVRVDMPISYVDEGRDYGAKLIDIAKDYPVYYPWLHMFKEQVRNKIDGNALYWQDTDMLKKIFPAYKLDGTTITHFFKSKLNAPDELVTAIGRVFENTELNATYTLSIDPVDIMLSSENPYDWTSCYRLEEFSESHADGCLAGVIDSDTVMSYVWNNQGKFMLYDKYEFKNIRYKRVRITLAINKTFNAVHFNAVYPWKGDATDTFKKLIRDKVETYLTDKTGKANMWRKWSYDFDKDRDMHARRDHSEYGYGEYDYDYVWMLKDEDEYAPFEIYNSYITCPCGCGDNYGGSDRDWECYNGEGHCCYNWYEEEPEDEWCDYADDYVSCDHDCEHCPDYNRSNAVCELDNSYRCDDRDLYDAEYDGDADWCESNVVSCNPEHCKECPLYRQHHPEVADQPTEEENNEQNQGITTWTINDSNSHINYVAVVDNIVTYPDGRQEIIWSDGHTTENR